MKLVFFCLFFTLVLISFSNADEYRAQCPSSVSKECGNNKAILFIGMTCEKVFAATGPGVGARACNEEYKICSQIKEGVKCITPPACFNPISSSSISRTCEDGVIGYKLQADGTYSMITGARLKVFVKCNAQCVPF